ncbi:collagen alpha-1(I) chain-like [Sorex araneus]|uniref:collagen alpha-1(I) chain-like n=1 Tax=Sorex araneus TaxID=42254 RepID=UPI002433F86C|nr:collagen alpha-1(I) chain-like [Sorex araneus]
MELGGVGRAGGPRGSIRPANRCPAPPPLRSILLRTTNFTDAGGDKGAARPGSPAARAPGFRGSGYARPSRAGRAPPRLALALVLARARGRARDGPRRVLGRARSSIPRGRRAPPYIRPARARPAAARLAAQPPVAIAMSPPPRVAASNWLRGRGASRTRSRPASGVDTGLVSHPRGAAAGPGSGPALQPFLSAERSAGKFGQPRAERAAGPAGTRSGGWGADRAVAPTCAGRAWGSRGGRAGPAGRGSRTRGEKRLGRAGESENFATDDPGQLRLRRGCQARKAEARRPRVSRRGRSRAPGPPLPARTPFPGPAHGSPGVSEPRRVWARLPFPPPRRPPQPGPPERPQVGAPPALRAPASSPSAALKRNICAHNARPSPQLREQGEERRGRARQRRDSRRSARPFLLSWKPRRPPPGPLSRRRSIVPSARDSWRGSAPAARPRPSRASPAPRPHSAGPPRPRRPGPASAPSRASRQVPAGPVAGHRGEGDPPCPLPPAGGSACPPSRVRLGQRSERRRAGKARGGPPLLGPAARRAAPQLHARCGGGTSGETCLKDWWPAGRGFSTFFFQL